MEPLSDELIAVLLAVDNGRSQWTSPDMPSASRCLGKLSSMGFVVWMEQSEGHPARGWYTTTAGKSYLCALKVQPAKPTRDETQPAPGFEHQTWHHKDTGYVDRYMREDIVCKKVEETWVVYDAEHGYAPSVDVNLIRTVIEEMRHCAPVDFSYWIHMLEQATKTR